MRRPIQISRVQDVVRARICARCSAGKGAAIPRPCERRCPLLSDLPQLWAVALRDGMLSNPKQALRSQIRRIAVRRQQHRLRAPARLPRNYRARLEGLISELAGLR